MSTTQFLFDPGLARTVILVWPSFVIERAGGRTEALAIAATDTSLDMFHEKIISQGLPAMSEGHKGRGGHSGQDREKVIQYRCNTDGIAQEREYLGP